MKSLKFLLTICLFCFTLFSAWAQTGLQIAKLKYNGGGDWYANKTALTNLINFSNQHLNTKINSREAVVEVGSPELFSYPYVYMTGHGNVVFTTEEAQNLRTYLISGAFCAEWRMHVGLNKKIPGKPM